MLLSPPALIQSGASGNQEASEVIRRFESAFITHRLDTFESSRRGPIRVRYIHSLKEPSRGGRTVHIFHSFKSMERWLRSRETTDGGQRFPIREVRQGHFDGRDLFRYDNTGIQHSHLYLDSLSLRKRDGHCAIIEVAFYDGD